MVTDGQEGDNRFQPNPKTFMAVRTAVTGISFQQDHFPGLRETRCDQMIEVDT